MEYDAYTPQVSVPDAKVADEIWWLKTLLDEEYWSAWISTGRISLYILLSTCDLPVQRYWYKNVIHLQ